MKIGELVHKRGRLQRRGLDALEHARVGASVFANGGARRAEDDGQRVLHVVRNGGENRGSFGAQLSLASRKVLRLELLFTLGGDEQADRNGNRAENNLVFPLFEGRQSPG